VFSDGPGGLQVDDGQRLGVISKFPLVPLDIWSRLQMTENACRRL
jgi:hypothetical protein